MEFVSWDDDIPNMMGKIKFMFQTTNQLILKIMEFVSWDDEIPNMMGKIKNVPNNQPVDFENHGARQLGR